MFSFFRKNRGLTLDGPAVTLTKDAADCRAALDSAGVCYETDEEGCIVFSGRAFGAEFPMEFRLHIDGRRVTFVEISRQTELPVEQAFAELSAVLQNRFGKTIFASAAATKQLPCEQWYREGLNISHFQMEHNGLHEYLHIIMK